MPHCIETLANGVAIWQVTDDPRPVYNLYCERPYVSPDGSRFLYGRAMGGELEYLLCEFGTWRSEVVGRGLPSVGVSYQGDHYYARRGAHGAWEVVRIALHTGQSEVRFTLPRDQPGIDCHPAVSPDGRYLAFSSVLSFAPQRFGVFLADRDTGQCARIHEDPWICNAHGQFDAGQGRTLMLQHNRGCEFTPDGKMVKCVGEKDGCTLFLLEVPSGKVTRLPIGIPYTAPLTGHEAWVGRSAELIFTVESPNAYTGAADAAGNILLIRPGENHRRIAQGVAMMHIGTTPCGRYFHADGNPQGRIIVGSPRTGRFMDVCLSHAKYTPQFGQMGHPHAYLAPDFRWMVFNSDRTGSPQVYAAAIPAGLFDGLD